MNNFLVFFIILIFYIVVFIATIVTPIILCSDLMLNSKKTNITLTLSAINFISITIIVLNNLGLNIFGDELYYSLASYGINLFDILWCIILISSLISYIFLFYNMYTDGYFSKKPKKNTFIVSIVCYVIEFIALLFPIISNYNGFQILSLYTGFFSIFMIFALIISPILGIIINLIFKDGRKTLIFNLLFNFSYFYIAIALTLVLAVYQVYSFGIFIMIISSFIGSVNCTIIQGWYGMIESSESKT